MRVPLAALPPIVLAAAAMGPASCGATSKSSADNFKGRQKGVAQAVDDLRDAASKRNGQKICDTYLTPKLKNRLAALARQTKRGVSCADQLNASIQDADSLDLKVLSVRISGNTATAKVQTTISRGRKSNATLTLVNQRGWRLDRMP